MEPIVFVVLLTAATGVGGPALGGALAALLRRESPRGTGLLLGFTAGLMLSVAALDMAPEAVEAVEGEASVLLVPAALALGFGVTWLLNRRIDRGGHRGLHTAGLMLAAAVALHNVPVGMAVGATVAVQGVGLAGVLAAVTIGLHNLPEGMSIAVPLLHDGASVPSAVAVAALSGVPAVLGALAGWFLGGQTPMALAAALGLAGGAMLYVVFFELLPEAVGQWRSKWPVLAGLAGIALGALLIFGGGHGH